MIRSLLLFTLSTLFGLGLAPAARAHEYWLEPTTYRAAIHDTLSVAAFAGTGFRGERKPYPAPRTLRLSLDGPTRRDLKAVATNGELTFARFVQPDDMGSVVSFHSSFTPIELPAGEFDAYLRLEGLEGPLAARARLGAAAGPGRERYGRCAKTWISGRPGASSRVTRPVGLPLEVVPMTDPERGTRLRVRVLYHGKPLAHALVRAWRQPLAGGAVALAAAARDSVGPAAEARTDRRGVATLPLGRTGEWLVSTVHMVPSEDRAVADWQSLWSSLTFAR